MITSELREDYEPRIVLETVRVQVFITETESLPCPSRRNGLSKYKKGVPTVSVLL